MTGKRIGRPPKDPAKPAQPPVIERRQVEQTFAGLFRNGEETPESLIVKVMHGQDRIQHDGKRRRITKEMREAAAMLLPYRLPRLNAIDAVQRSIEMTHEDWIREMDGGPVTET